MTIDSDYPEFLCIAYSAKYLDLDIDKTLVKGYVYKYFDSVETWNLLDMLITESAVMIIIPALISVFVSYIALNRFFSAVSDKTGIVLTVYPGRILAFLAAASVGVGVLTLLRPVMLCLRKDPLDILRSE